MAIVFRCTGCNSKFEVDARLAGKTGRCKKCGLPMTIPREPEPDFRLAMAGANLSARRPVAAAVAVPAHPVSWIEAVTSQAALKPISMAALKPVGRATPLDDGAFSGPYQIAGSIPAARPVGGSRAAGGLVIGYRKQWTGIARFFRWINEQSYLVSVPFLLVLIMGALLQNQALTMLGATVVVLLNVARLVSGLANLAAIPFREGPIQGVMFLIPPLTFIYLSQHWKRMRKPCGRVIEPIVTLGLVVLAFTFIPSLGMAQKSTSGTVTERIQAGAKDLGQGIQKEIPVDTTGLGAKARGAVKNLGEQVQPAARSIGDKARDAVKSVQEQVQGTSGDTKKPE